ncbi:YsnF/AvaK domain-containing protein [Methylobacterium sp. E-065]|uniref:YsnF/AvaK domain-containing protein n=1 Tax=Methylobacterium sp. E-065 TaxID=2836583 RepID=UPI001FBBCE69|nr:YsnF/AvaK domain-containing protein [Methylobacterium sp. E-065]MCJ2019541.1 YsnF/AvaK domain-containing protein [Methylobacterium sp. E-065]
MSDPAASQPKLSRTQVAEAAEVTVGEEVVLPLIEESARIDKRAVETGRVRVSTQTETVEQVLRESLRSDTVAVTRVPVNRTLADGETLPVIHEEGGVTIIPVLEEILVVEKRLVLKEEVHIRRSSADEDVEVPVTLRKQRAVVERVSPDGHASEQIDPLSTEETTP